MRLRRCIRLTIYFLCALSALYSAAWYIIADRLDRGMARWADGRRFFGDPDSLVRSFQLHLSGDSSGSRRIRTLGYESLGNRPGESSP